jgi:prepilin-type N-terminal cleavage/methylation domain-containing protein
MENLPILQKYYTMRNLRNYSGFTLVELSIALIIIGLILGGILIGKDLIAHATIKSTISQIEQYKTATNTFKLKYKCIPGDCAQAANFGFPARGLYSGQGDGNGMLQGVWANGAGNEGGSYQYIGETALYWVDLSQAGLIDSRFNTASATAATTISKSQDDYFPKSKLGNSHINIWGGYLGWKYLKPRDNYFQISKLPSLVDSEVLLNAGVGLTVMQAYSIDTKLDDGNPRTGNVGTIYMYQWNTNDSTSAITADATTCLHGPDALGNGSNVSYSMNIGSGEGQNCALTIHAGF